MSRSQNSNHAMWFYSVCSVAGLVVVSVLQFLWNVRKRCSAKEIFVSFKQEWVNSKVFVRRLGILQNAHFSLICVSVLFEHLYWFPVKDSVGKIEDIFTLEERERSCSIACDSDKRNTQWSDWGPCRRDCSKKESSGSQVRSRTSFLYKRNMTDSEFEERYILKERKDLSKRLLLLEIRY